MALLLSSSVIDSISFSFRSELFLFLSLSLSHLSDSSRLSPFFFSTFHSRTSAIIFWTKIHLELFFWNATQQLLCTEACLKANCVFCKLGWGFMHFSPIFVRNTRRTFISSQTLQSLARLKTEVKYLQIYPPPAPPLPPFPLLQVRTSRTLHLQNPPPLLKLNTRERETERDGEKIGGGEGGRGERGGEDRLCWLHNWLALSPACLSGLKR